MQLNSVQEAAVTRWKLGHHLFHLLLTTMNTRLDEAIRQLGAQQPDAAAATLRELTRLFDAATAAMRYAADFPRTEYEHLIRPSMMPPFAHDGFSGVYNTEHRAMLARLRTLRRLYGWSPVPPRLHDAWRSLRDAQRANARNHMYVCRRFVDDGASLLQEFYARRRGPQA